MILLTVLGDLELMVLEPSMQLVLIFQVFQTLDSRKTLLMQILSGMISKHLDLEIIIGNLILDMQMEKLILV